MTDEGIIRLLPQIEECRYHPNLQCAITFLSVDVGATKKDELPKASFPFIFYPQHSSPVFSLGAYAACPISARLAKCCRENTHSSGLEQVEKGANDRIPVF